MYNMKTLKVTVIVICVILILPLLGYAGWLVKKGHPLEVFVVNKSMISYKGSENKAFNNVLNVEKALTSGNRIYHLKKDHYGLIWNNGDYRIKYPRLKEHTRIAEKFDLFYYADASGIRTSDTRELEYEEYDKILFGGVNNTDYNLVKDIVSLNKTLILECNFFGPPTDELVRYNMEKLTDVYYVGWRGKYVSDLAGVPDPAPGFDWKELYLQYTGTPWNYTGPGIVMFNQSAGRIFVLEEGKHIQTSEGLIFSSEEGVRDFGLPENVNYEGWFTLLHPGNNKVLSDFQLNATDEGIVKLNEFGVPVNFPALIRGDENFYFMTGDFGKCKSNSLLPKILVIGPLFDKIKADGKSSSNFYYSFYKPLMTTIVRQALEQRNNE